MKLAEIQTDDQAWTVVYLRHGMICIDGEYINYDGIRVTAPDEGASFSVDEAKLVMDAIARGVKEHEKLNEEP